MTTKRIVSVAIVTLPGWRSEMTDAIRIGLTNRGFQVDLFHEGDKNALKKDCILLMGSLLQKSASLIDRSKEHPPMTIVWQSEPLPSPELGKRTLATLVAISKVRYNQKWVQRCVRIFGKPIYYFAHMFGKSGISLQQNTLKELRFAVDNLYWLKRGRDRKWLTQIGATTEQKRIYLEENGYPSFLLPVGISPAFGSRLDLERDIDVLFIGNVKSKIRRSRVAEVFEKLESFGCKVHLAPRGTEGDVRTHLVNRSKIVLHIHQFPWDTPWMRWSLATANGAVVASEELSVPYPLRRGHDYLSAPYDQLAKSIFELLSDEPRRLKMLANCQETLNTHMSLEGSLDKVASMIEQLTLENKGRDK